MTDRGAVRSAAATIVAGLTDSVLLLYLFSRLWLREKVEGKGTDEAYGSTYALAASVGISFCIWTVYRLEVRPRIFRGKFGSLPTVPVSSSNFSRASLETIAEERLSAGRISASLACDGAILDTARRRFSSNDEIDPQFWTDSSSRISRTRMHLVDEPRSLDRSLGPASICIHQTRWRQKPVSAALWTLTHHS